MVFYDFHWLGFEEPDNLLFGVCQARDWPKSREPLSHGTVALETGAFLSDMPSVDDFRIPSETR